MQNKVAHNKGRLYRNSCIRILVAGPGKALQKPQFLARCSTLKHKHADMKEIYHFICGKAGDDPGEMKLMWETLC